MQDFDASDGVATINANTTVTATRMGRPVFDHIQPVAPAKYYSWAEHLNTEDYI
jgi:hypothetical protein